ncbi:GIY-YIG nuclease family protein [Pseudohaliea rubra]|uniref:Putative endonuclease n=1 Tax=Pseudohaliea rubra DSM 19751 TaxID=1265313 RepID=A0A095VRM6_9GAMM|nr:GIY-YIG nuclease family protein [Pseudohaliea rubra]KGE04025.1 putative endonuclease [Pseudohaliea rubra DSM 19751]
MADGSNANTRPGVDQSAAGAWTVYVLCCADGSLYTGVTRDLARRLRQHNGELAGGPRYTRGRRPVVLGWSAAAASRSEAQRQEARIKRWPRRAKLRLLHR